MLSLGRLTTVVALAVNAAAIKAKVVTEKRILVVNWP